MKDLFLIWILIEIYLIFTNKTVRNNHLNRMKKLEGKDRK